MFFRNLTLYRLMLPASMTAEAIGEKLSIKAFTRCGSSDIRSAGFAHFSAGEFAFTAPEMPSQILIQYRTEEKLLPPSVINQVAQERAEEFEEQQGFKPGRKMMKELKEAIERELLPRAFTRIKTVRAWIDTRAEMIAIDTPSQSRAEEVICALIDALDIHPRILQTERSAVSCMNDWLAAGDAPVGFTIDRDCELRAITDDKASVRYKHLPIADVEEIADHLAEGKHAVSLALTFDDRISFVITERMQIKRLAFLDIVQEQAEKAAADGADQEAADLALMSGELRCMIAALVKAMGGILREEAGDLADQGGAA